MKYFRHLLAISLCLTVVFSAASAQADQSGLFQVSTRQALEAGGFDGATSIDELKKHGDLGFGFLNGLDGVLVALDGAFYKVAGDGKVAQLNDSAKTPFAAVTRFTTDRLLKIEKIDGLKQLEERLSSLLPTPNIFYAVLVQGRFDSVKTSSISMQSKPYLAYKQAMAQQSVFKLADVEGALIGFKYPCSAKCLGGPGYLWSFLAKDRSSGGRVLDCSFKGLTAKIKNIHLFTLKLPSDSTFYDLVIPKHEPAAEGEATPKTQQ